MSFIILLRIVNIASISKGKSHAIVMLCLFGNVFEENPEILFPELMDGLPRINMDNQRW